ncbi:crossover junction endodeoxyribonuclease RuvC [Desulfovibrio sp. OttesenSCG-928-G15]|nr:crossover junction endodeoxyribonuclease RuvC [Desulfovibrio sp. OttesenSCG-928-G15]
MAISHHPPIAVLGIDPGSQCLGWGIVREQSGVLTLVACGTVRPKGNDFSARLGNLFVQLADIVCLHKPDEAAVENVFTHKNILSALKLGQARGAAIAACAAHGVPVTDYEPTLIKKTLVGNGRAEKTQVAYMVSQLLGKKADWALDTTDALGAAICHLNMRRLTRLSSPVGRKTVTI